MQTPLSRAASAPRARAPRRPLAAALTLVAAIALAPGPAAAQGGDKKAIAEAAFVRGRELMDQGKPAEACPKFEESSRLDPSVGAFLNLGLCNEQLGRTATAWARYKEAATLAHATGDTDRLRIAEEFAGKLAPKLSRLRIDAETPAAGLVIKRNGEVVGAALLGDPIPVDPGEHTIGATAPGFLSWSTKIVVGKDADAKTVSVPALVAAPNVKPVEKETSDAPPAASGTNGLRIAAFVAGGVGVAALGVGAVFGGLASSDVGKADPLCPEKKCNAEGFALIEGAQTKALASTIGFGVGGAALAAGVVLFFVSRSAPKEPGPEAPRAWLVPSFGPHGGGASILGTF
ncbi:hypothetical protein [Polyangium mundeleinium]|uniref:Tetratricopeptide repeat protein n=1 Tax=Polyangium mundeleinium TaxID=2995306 RepID=A0ABT5EMB8_9BACT|nr:hypothetical protein [Polyangium mundeleinium]MDC0742911.1 hypothetical protein [Polyangium mundeleinium]